MSSSNQYAETDFRNSSRYASYSRISAANLLDHQAIAERSNNFSRADLSEVASLDVLSTARESNLTTTDIKITIQNERNYVTCKERIDSRAIWRYIQEKREEITENEEKLLKFCIAEIAKINRPWITNSMELRVFSDLFTGSNPVFIAGARSHKFVAIWHDNKIPEFVEVKEHVINYLPTWCLKFIVFFVIFCVFLMYLWFFTGRFQDFMIDLAKSVNVTVNVNGETDSDLTFDDLDININMNAGD